MTTTYVYMLPKNLRKEILLDCYNTLRESGMSHEEAKHEVSHYITCSRLCDLECLVDVRKYL